MSQEERVVNDFRAILRDKGITKNQSTLTKTENTLIDLLKRVIPKEENRINEKGNRRPIQQLVVAMALMSTKVFREQPIKDYDNAILAIQILAKTQKELNNPTEDDIFYEVFNNLFTLKMVAKL